MTFVLDWIALTDDVTEEQLQLLTALYLVLLKLFMLNTKFAT